MAVLRARTRTRTLPRRPLTSSHFFAAAVYLATDINPFAAECTRKTGKENKVSPSKKQGKTCNFVGQHSERK